MCAARPAHMHTTLGHHGLLAFDPIAPRDVAFVLDNARALQLAAQAGGAQALLRGRKFGLMCEMDNAGDSASDSAGDSAGDSANDSANDSAGDAALFRRAAVELGAHVAYIRPSLTELSTPLEVQHTARMLGRLYDAVECQGMAADLVHQLGIDAGVPVYDAVASQRHPTAKLDGMLGSDSPAPDKRRFVLQAVLLSTVA